MARRRKPPGKVRKHIAKVVSKPTARASLTAPQIKAVDVLLACEDYAEGWGILVTNHGSHEQDGQAWVFYWSGLRLVAKGYCEYDEQFGRIRLNR